MQPLQTATAFIPAGLQAAAKSTTLTNTAAPSSMTAPVNTALWTMRAEFFFSPITTALHAADTAEITAAGAAITPL